jgi:hypothetical protein
MNTSCPVCLVKKPQRRGPVSYCPVCQHVFQSDLTVTAKYDRDYIAERYEAYPTTDAMSSMRAGFLSALVQRGKLLDVGYGNGAFVKMAQKSGYDAYGADVHGCDFGVREHKLVSSEQYQVVTFFDSLEHFADFEPVRDLMPRTQYVLVSFPCRPRWFPDDLGWKHYRPGEHLHYFSSTSIARLFSRFQVVAESDLEDAIRGKLLKEEQNISTMLFKRVS